MARHVTRGSSPLTRLDARLGAMMRRSLGIMHGLATYALGSTGRAFIGAGRLVTDALLLAIPGALAERQRVAMHQTFDLMARSFRESELDPSFASRKAPQLRRTIACSVAMADDLFVAAGGAAGLNTAVRRSPEATERMHAAHSAALASGKGFVLGFPHLGSVPALVATAAETGRDVVVLARESDLPESPAVPRHPLDLVRYGFTKSTELSRAIRKRFTERAIASAGGSVLWVNPNNGKEVVRQARAAVRKGGVVAIATDYYSKASGGVQVTIGGADRVVGAGPAIIAIAEGVPVVAAAARHTKAGYELDVRGPILPPSVDQADHAQAIGRLTDKIATLTDELIREDPFGWACTQTDDRTRAGYAQRADARLRRAGTSRTGAPAPIDGLPHELRDRDPLAIHPDAPTLRGEPGPTTSNSGRRGPELAV